MSYKIYENRFGSFETVVLTNNNESVEIALKGATIINYFINTGNNKFNVIDGFADEEEFKSARGARSWIMIPFANRIPDGKYVFKDREYQLEPIPPRTQVIHGFASYMDYKIDSSSANKEKASVTLKLNKIRPGLVGGYPFAIDIYLIFTLSKDRFEIQVTAENIGDTAAPFATGWHPYFRTNMDGIENLILTLNAEEIILLDNNYIPLQGKNAYSKIDKSPDLNFNDYIPEDMRIINNRKLDTCYASLKKDETGLSESSLYDPENGLKIIMYQYGGVTLAFSGDSLSQRKRKSVALEPMQFITNAFNRSEFADKISIVPGGRSVFKFGVRKGTNE